MKKIVLIGDSIRMGYDKYVKEALADVAEVYYPLENARYSTNLLRFLHEWKDKGEWPTDADLVHWNVGLWDAVELFGDDPLTPIEYYEKNIKRIYNRIKQLFPNAKQVFATSTAGLEHRFVANARRTNASIQNYNEAAKRALADTDVIINDLFSLTVSCPEEYHSDAVHFNTDAGRELIGGRVISVICKMLDIPATEVNIENFEPENYSAANIGY